MRRKGLFISFESIDGVGKTTQVEMLLNRLRDAGHEVYRTKEPGDTWYGSIVGRGVRHQLFSDPTTHNMRPGVSDMLLLADHVQNSGDIADAVDAGKVVVTDRYADSQFAYAAVPSRRCPLWTLGVYKDQFGIEPDLTFLLRARGKPAVSREGGEEFCRERRIHLLEDISWAFERANARKGHEAGKQDGKTWNDAEDQRRIQDAYLVQLKDLPRTVVIDIWENSTKEEIANLIWDCVTLRLPAAEQDKAKAA